MHTVMSGNKYEFAWTELNKTLHEVAGQDKVYIALPEIPKQLFSPHQPHYTLAPPVPLRSKPQMYAP